MRNNNQQILGIPPDTSNNGFFIGTAGFDYKNWCGGFYNDRSSISERLDIYQAYFSFVELSCYLDDDINQNTFDEFAKLLRGSTVCSVRVPKRISCPKAWQPKIGMQFLNQVIDSVYPLFEAGRLYSLVFSIDEKTIRSERVLGYLVEVAGHARTYRMPTHVEFRHRSWHTPHVLQSLKDHGLGICNIEIPVDSGFPLKYYATTEKGYVRYYGRNLRAWRDSVRRHKQERFEYDYSTSEIETMAEGQIKLSKKVSLSAIVYGNISTITAVGNAIQNALILDHKIQMARVLARNRQSYLSSAQNLKIT